MSLSRTFRSYFAVSFALHAALPGCGAPPPPQAPVAPVAAAALAPPVVAPALDAVAAPPTLLVSGRVARPGASMSIVHGWTQLPVVRSEELTELMMGEAFGALVDVDQPMDFAVAITGSGLSMHALAALSVAIKDVDRAKALLTDRYKLTPGENGALLVQGLGAEAVHPDAEDAPSGRRVCELAPAYGAAPTRLVCGATTKALTELGPWLTRTLTRSPAVEDLHVDVRTQAIRATLAKDRRLISMLLTSALGEREGLTRDLASALAKDLVDFAADLDGLSLAVTLSEPAARAFLRFDLSGKTSSLARLMTLSTPKSPSGAGAFLELPGDADIAVFEPGINDDLWAQWRDVVLPAAASALAGFDVRDASRAAIADALGKLVPLGAISYASGVDTDAVRNAISAEKAAVDGRSPSSDPAAVRTATVEALFGWHVLAVDQPAAQLTAGWKDLAAALARSGSKDRAAPVARLLPMPRGAALPAGALHYEIEVRAAESSPSSNRRSRRSPSGFRSR